MKEKEKKKEKKKEKEKEGEMIKGARVVKRKHVHKYMYIMYRVPQC